MHRIASLLLVDTAGRHLLFVDTPGRHLLFVDTAGRHLLFVDTPTRHSRSTSADTAIRWLLVGKWCKRRGAN